MSEEINQKDYQILDKIKLENEVESDVIIKTLRYELTKQKEMLDKYLKVQGEEIKPLLFGVRAEDVVLDIDKKDRHHLSSKMKIHIDLCELLGHEYYLTFNIGDKLIFLLVKSDIFLFLFSLKLLK